MVRIIHKTGGGISPPVLNYIGVDV